MSGYEPRHAVEKEGRRADAVRDLPFGFEREAQRSMGEARPRLARSDLKADPRMRDVFQDSMRPSLVSDGSWKVAEDIVG